jgi:hypothetical protein
MFGGDFTSADPITQVPIHGIQRNQETTMSRLGIVFDSDSLSDHH